MTLLNGPGRISALDRDSKQVESASASHWSHAIVSKCSYCHTIIAATMQSLRLIALETD